MNIWKILNFTAEKDVKTWFITAVIMWKKQREKNKFQWLEQDSTHDHFDPSAELYQLSNFALCSALRRTKKWRGQSTARKIRTSLRLDFHRSLLSGLQWISLECTEQRAQSTRRQWPTVAEDVKQSTLELLRAGSESKEHHTQREPKTQTNYTENIGTKVLWTTRIK